MYIPKYFQIQELVPRAIFESYPEKKRANLWFLFDERALITADRLRERYGSMVCNTWLWGGDRQYSGWRPGDCAEGSLLSQHKRGAAFDFLPQKITAEEIRRDILTDPNCQDFEFITCIEAGVAWLHFDTRNWDKKERGIFTVKP